MSKHASITRFLNELRYTPQMRGKVGPSITSLGPAIYPLSQTPAIKTLSLRPHGDQPRLYSVYILHLSAMAAVNQRVLNWLYSVLTGVCDLHCISSFNV